MNNPQCAACGHVNRVGAASCEACDARLYAAEDAAPAADFGDTREPFDYAGGPSWAASDTSGPDDWSPADDIPAPPFKTAGDVISPMLAVYRKHFTLVGILVLVTTVPQALLQYGIMDVAGSGPGSVTAHSGGGAMLTTVVVSGLLLWLLALAASSVLSGSLVYAVLDLQRVGSASAGECLSRGLKALPKVLLVSLVYAVIVIVGYLMLIVPGVIFSLMFAVSVPVAVIEGLGPIAALKRSHELTKGYKGLIFVTFFLWGLLITVISWIVQWSFMRGGEVELPMLLLQAAVLGMLSSTVHVLTVYVYLGLLRERRSRFQTHAYTR
jgi:hypothetical protein